MPTPTNRYKGVPLTVTATPSFPTTAAAIPIAGIKSFRYDEGVSQKLESADGDAFDSVVFNDFRKPTLSLETLNAFVMYSQIPSVRNTIAATYQDVYNGVVTGGGAKLLTMTDAFIAGRNIDATYREYNKQSLTFGCISSDGQTHPVTIAAV